MRGRMAVKGHLSAQGLWLLLLFMQTSLGADELRLEKGGTPCAGRVEIKHQDVWGTVCDDGWDMTHAAVVCRQLGCGSAVSAPPRAHFGQGSGRIWMAGTDCHGNKSALSDCSRLEGGDYYCSHSEDASVICSGHIEARLAGVSGTCIGRVEIKWGDTWGSICDSHFDLKAASVLCNQLQCGTALSTLGGARFGEGRGPVWKEEFQCQGKESHLFYCPRTPYVDQSCSHGNDVGILCSKTPRRRSLTGGRDRVPIFICIVLGALLCLILIIVGGKVRSARALHRGSGRYSGPLPDAVYEEIDNNLMREKLELFGRSVSYSGDSVMKLQYYTGDSEEGNDPGSAQEEASPGDFQLHYDSVEESAVSDAHVPPDSQGHIFVSSVEELSCPVIPSSVSEAFALDGGVTEDGYDEAGEVPNSAHFPVSGLTGVPAEGEENVQTYRDSQTEWSTPWLKSEGICEVMQDDPALLPGDTGYDDVEDAISVSSP